MIKQVELVEKWGLSKGMVSMMVKRGMPLASVKRMLVAERDRADHSHQATIRAIIAQVDAARVIAGEVGK